MPTWATAMPTAIQGTPVLVMGTITPPPSSGIASAQPMSTTLSSAPEAHGSEYFTDTLTYYNNTLVLLSGTSYGFIATVNTGLLKNYNNIVYSKATGDMDLFCLLMGMRPE